MAKKWYALHTYSGFEGRVKASIEEKIKTLKLEDKISQVLLPTESVVELKEGKKRVSIKKFFPGYVLIEMDLTDETWHLIKNIPKVTGFIGSNNKPSPLSDEEVDVIRKQMDTGVAVTKAKSQFQKGDSVRIADGPFLGFTGVIDEIDLDHRKLRVMVSIFGRSTPVELDFLQAEKV
ncbi:MAG: transcription termination/antitermination protein NusG [Nitrospirae bacterium]|nr:transcription termination/antitermination protein NusG [Nitrospirota bacterium]